MARQSNFYGILDALSGLPLFITAPLYRHWHIRWGATDEEVRREVDRQLHQATADSLKARVYLISEKGGRVPLKDYYPPSGDGAGAKIVFPRFVSGQPVVGQTDKELGFEFTVPGPEHKIFVIWKVKDLVCEGQMLL